MVKGSIAIRHPLGLHLRPASELCTEAMNFKSLIELHKGNATVNAKSVLSVLGACIRQDDEVEVICTGPDEETALQAVLGVMQKVNDKA